MLKIIVECIQIFDAEREDIGRDAGKLIENIINKVKAKSAFCFKLEFIHDDVWNVAVVINAKDRTEAKEALKKYRIENNILEVTKVSKFQ